MDGVLVVDKPQGLTSHDVVAAARRLLREQRIGHTGTLDPLATGVLPLAIGRATRLARFLTASEKEYEATIRFGVTTDTLDTTGRETGRTGIVPSRDEVVGALQALTGVYMQRPPAYSAKKVAGHRAYQLARDEQPVELAEVRVEVPSADLLGMEGSDARVRITCSAGFYVRSFAHGLGERTRSGACLAALRRTRSGEFRVDRAVPLDALADAARVRADLVPMSALLPQFPAVRVGAAGRAHVAHGRELGAGDYEALGGAGAGRPAADWVRLVDEAGDLLGLATTGGRQDALHPSVVLM